MLAQYTLIQLREIAKERGYSGYSRLPKKDLIMFIESEGRKSPTPMKIEIRREVKREVRNRRDSNEAHEYTPEFLRLNQKTNKYVQLNQLGKSGKEGTVYLVIDPETTQRYAMKTFRKKKSPATLEKEAFYQHLASQKGISPKVIEYNQEDKYIVMELLNKTLIDLIKEHGTLRPEYQKQILSLYRKLDDIGIMINDANPLNIMEKNGVLYIIDYGMAKFTNHKDFQKYYPTPNYALMPTGLLLWLRNKCATRGWSILRDAVPRNVQIEMKMAEWP